VSTGHATASKEPDNTRGSRQRKEQELEWEAGSGISLAMVASGVGVRSTVQAGRGMEQTPSVSAQKRGN